MLRRIAVKAASVFVLSIVTFSFPVSASVTLVEDGEPRSAVVVSEEREMLEPVLSDSFPYTAADELVKHLELMTGAELEVVNEGEEPEGLLPIYLGGAADAALDEASREAGVNPSTFTLRVREDRIDIRGLSDEATLFGVYELLEELGFRWYNLGDLGRVIPDGDTASVAIRTESQAPDIVWRRLQHTRLDWPWVRRNRFGGDERSTGRHGIPGAPSGTGEGRQHCLSDPEVLEGAVEGIRERAESKGGDVQYVGAASHDGGGYCQCEECKELDQGVFDPFGARESMTDRYIWFFNQVLDELEDEFPNLHIVHYTYGAHMMPPAIEMNERIVPVFAPITLDRTRGMDNPMSPDRHTLRWLIDEYAERGVNEMYYRGYYNNLACVQLPFSQLDRIRHETPAFAENDITVMRVEMIRNSWSSNFLNPYVAGRMMWDVDTDVDALLEEFYELYYGPAEEPMRAYHEGLESAFRDTPYFTGSSYLYFPLFKTHPRRDELRSHLEEAEELAGDYNEEIYAERVDAVRFNWERLDLFMDLMKARNNHDFGTAKELQEEFLERTARGVETHFGYEDEDYEYGRDGAFISWREHPDRGDYYGRFFKQPVDAGYRRAVEEGEIAATLPDEWDFLLDTADIGEIAGYYRPGELGGNWQTMKTKSRSASDQGLHYERGPMWYRVTGIEIPEEFEEREIYLWFGAVHRKAAVWINGEYVGTSTEPEEGLPGVPGTFRSFDMPATNAVNFGEGETNTVAVKITHEGGIGELGVRGIIAPVMFWSPHDPDWTP